MTAKLHVDMDAVEEAAKLLYIRALKILPDDIKGGFRRLDAAESDGTAKSILATMIENIAVAERTENLLCQDTGIPIYNVEIGRDVEIDGFALKRYGYPLADVSIISSQGDREEKGKRRETALLVARRAEWRKPPSTAETSTVLSWIFAGLGAAVAAAVIYGVWASGRAARLAERQARAALPDRINVPGDRT